MNTPNAKMSKLGRFKILSNMTEAFQSISQEKRRGLDNPKTTKEHLGEICAYDIELESDIALAETAEIT